MIQFPNKFGFLLFTDTLTLSAQKISDTSPGISVVADKVVQPAEFMHQVIIGASRRPVGYLHCAEEIGHFSPDSVSLISDVDDLAPKTKLVEGMLSEALQISPLGFVRNFQRSMALQCQFFNCTLIACWHTVNGR